MAGNKDKQTNMNIKHHLDTSFLMDDIVVSEELIQKTLHKIKMESESIKLDTENNESHRIYDKKVTYRTIGFGSTIAAAILVVLLMTNIIPLNINKSKHTETVLTTENSNRMEETSGAAEQKKVTSMAEATVADKELSDIVTEADAGTENARVATAEIENSSESNIDSSAKVGISATEDTLFGMSTVVETYEEILSKEYVGYELYPMTSAEDINTKKEIVTDILGTILRYETKEAQNERYTLNYYKIQLEDENGQLIRLYIGKEITALDSENTKIFAYEIVDYESLLKEIQEILKK